MYGNVKIPNLIFESKASTSTYLFSLPMFVFQSNFIKKGQFDSSSVSEISFVIGLCGHIVTSGQTKKKNNSGVTVKNGRRVFLQPMKGPDSRFSNIPTDWCVQLLVIFHETFSSSKLSWLTLGRVCSQLYLVLVPPMEGRLSC